MIIMRGVRTFPDDGLVRQLWERRQDAGEWITILEGFYVRTPGNKP